MCSLRRPRATTTNPECVTCLAVVLVGQGPKLVCRVKKEEESCHVCLFNLHGSNVSM